MLIRGKEPGYPAGAASILDGENPVLPGVMLLVMFLGGAVLGALTLAAASWRSRYVDFAGGRQ